MSSVRVEMGRAGRKRKMGEREGNGRISRALYHEDERKVALDARRRVFGLTKKQAEHELAGTLVGRLALQGYLCPGDAEQIKRGERMAQTAVEFANLYREYQTVLQGPSEPRTVALERSPVGYPQEDLTAYQRAIVSRWEAVYEALAPYRLCFDALLDVAVHEEWPDEYGLINLRLGINRLARLWGR